MRLADLDFKRGAYDQAARGFAPIASASARLPDWVRAGALLQLARTHDLAGRRAEAVKLYKRLTDEFEEEAAGRAARLGLVAPYRRLQSPPT